MMESEIPKPEATDPEGKPEEENVEPQASERVLSEQRDSMSYEIVERGATAPSNMHLAGMGQRHRVIDDPDHELVQEIRRDG